MNLELLEILTGLVVISASIILLLVTVIVSVETAFRVADFILGR